ncbi:MAG: DUF4174 domain-containing protein [Bacteroidota bacterium]
MKAQDLAQHEWKHRILIIKADKSESSMVQKQLKEFNAVSNEMRARKLVVYHITGDNYTFLDFKNTQNDVGKVHGDLANVLKDKHDFEVILIGLDGGVKLRQTNILSQQALFDKIDSMPMRRSELRKHKY